MVGMTSGGTLFGIMRIVATRLGTTYSMTSLSCCSWVIRSHFTNMKMSVHAPSSRSSAPLGPRDAVNWSTSACCSGSDPVLPSWTLLSRESIIMIAAPTSPAGACWGP